MNKFDKRTKIVFFVFVAIGLFYIGQLYNLQIKKGDFFSNLADRQYLNPTSGLFSRGTIFFSSKDGNLMSAASTKAGFKLAIAPDRIDNPEKVYAQISAITPIDADRFFRSTAKKDDPYEEIKDRLSKEEADQIKALDLQGVNLFRENWRHYPTGNLAAQLIGFIAFRDNDIVGRYGLEKSYENVLKRNQDTGYINFFAEIFRGFTSNGDNKNKAGDIITTIEPSVQATLEKELQSIQEKWQSEKSGGIVIDPRTGQIIAMANSPTFDLNNFQNADSALYRNYLVEDVREMGSTIKPLIVAAGLDAGVISAETSYTDNGFVTVGNRTIFNFDKKGRGPNTTIQGVLNESLNTGMVYIQQKLGKELTKKYLLDFGIGEQTGIDLPGEGKNLIRNLETNRDVEYANISFGQGIALSPISMVRALSAMANGGYLVTPHLVKEIRYENGLSEEIFYERQGPILKPETSQEISRMLTEVVDTTLRNGQEKMENYSIAAKTGTAQIANPAGGYYDDRNLHSFFGYFPAYDPQYLVFFYTIHPKGARFSSQTLTDPFFNMAKFLIHYYNIQPDR